MNTDKTKLPIWARLAFWLWWLPPVLFVLLSNWFGDIMYVTTQYDTLLHIILMYISLLMISASVLLGLYKHWVLMTLSIIGNIIAWMTGLIITSICLFFSVAPDDFGKNHPIPEGLEYTIPYTSLDTIRQDIDRLDQQTHLQISADSQGGIYYYDFYASHLPAGTIYLKAFEVTENKPLTNDRLKQKSSTEIAPVDSFSKVVDNAEFTIYPGDWGDYYAARIEVWFSPASGDADRKLMEKTYRVEGWMR